MDGAMWVVLNLQRRKITCRARGPNVASERSQVYSISQERKLIERHPYGNAGYSEPVTTPKQREGVWVGMLPVSQRTNTHTPVYHGTQRMLPVTRPSCLWAT